MIFKKKSYGELISVEENSNVIYSEGLNSWQFIRPGSLLQVDNDVNFYQINRSETEDYELAFTRVNDKILVKNPVTELNENDVIFISVKEYEFFSLTSIVDAGNGYKQNEELQIEGGSPCVDVSTNTVQKTTFKIMEVNDNGAIIKIKPIFKGKYLSNKNIQTYDLIGGSGSGAKISAEFEMIGQKSEIEKSIAKIERTSSLCFVTFTNPLPEAVSEGYLKFSKSKIILSSNYIGKSKKLVKYSILKDFTPNYSMPLMSVDSTTPEIIFNNSIILIDKKIAELEKTVRILSQNRM